jgi:hypothetical protein
MEGYSFFKTEDSGHMVCLSKPGLAGMPEISKISRTQYDFVLQSAAVPAAARELTAEIIKKYEQAVSADIGKTRPNTAGNFWHNYRVLARKEALNPRDAMNTARRVLSEMPPAERSKFEKSLALYEKQKGRSYNDRILNFYENAVKDIPVRNRGPHDQGSLVTARYNRDTVDTAGKPIDSNVKLKIGDPVKLNLKIQDLVTGLPRRVLKTSLYLASSSESSNKVVVMSSDNSSKYVLSRESFIKAVRKIENRREKREQTAEKKQRRKAAGEALEFGY